MYILMKKIIHTPILISALIVLFTLTGYAQFPEDVLRLSTPGTGVGARSLGLGMAYTGVANDFSAMYWNPAGLAQLRMNEISLGLSNLSFGNTGTLSDDPTGKAFGNGQSFTNSGTNLNSLGFVYSVPTNRGSFVIALGYGRQTDFTTGLSFAGFNPRSSVIQSFAPDSAPTSNPHGANNLAFELYLADADSLGPNDFRWYSPIIGRVTQSGTVLEGGGLNNVSAAAAFEASPNLFLGLTLNIVTGSYSFNRKYYEDDLSNIYNGSPSGAVSPLQFQSLSISEIVESDLSGFSAKFGFLYKFMPNSRVGIAIKTPSWITVRETYSQFGTSDFDNGDHVEWTTADGVQNEYDVSTPFVFSGGASYGYQGLMLAGDLDYTDWTQMEFRNASSHLLEQNALIKKRFRSTVNLRLGAEYEVVPSVVQLRAGFAFQQSPYNGDAADYARKYITGGLSFALQNTMIVELGYAYGFWKDYVSNYKGPSITNEDIHTSNLLGTVSYRF